MFEMDFKKLNATRIFKWQLRNYMNLKIGTKFGVYEQTRAYVSAKKQSFSISYGLFHLSKITHICV